MTRGPMTRLLARRTLLILLGLLLLVETVFLGDIFSSNLEGVINNGGKAKDVILLLALRTPEIVDFALPLTVLLGLFFAITTARDNNELVICAAAGVSWVRVPVFAATVGLLAFVVSIGFSGFITPGAKYASRIANQILVARQTVEQIVTPEPKNTIRTLKNRIAIATPPTNSTAVRGNLYVFEEDKGDGWRFSQADDWTVLGPAEDGSYSINLKSFRDYRGRSSKNQNSANADNDQLMGARVNVSTLSLDFRLEELVSALDRTRKFAERPLVSTAYVAALLTGTDRTPVLNRRSGQILARAGLCIFAALAAVAAAAWSGTWQGRFTALPAAVVLVLGADVALRAILGDAAERGAQEFLRTYAGVMATAIILPLVYISTWREAILAPSHRRA